MDDPQKNWTLEQAQALAKQLEATERTLTLNKRQLISEVMYPTIAAKLKLGWTHQAVCEELAQLGIAVTPHTLRTYLKSRTHTRRSAVGGRQTPSAKAALDREPTTSEPSRRPAVAAPRPLPPAAAPRADDDASR